MCVYEEDYGGQSTRTILRLKEVTYCLTLAFCFQNINTVQSEFQSSQIQFKKTTDDKCFLRCGLSCKRARPIESIISSSGPGSGENALPAKTRA